MYIYKHFSNTEQLSGQSLKKGISLSNQQKNSEKWNNRRGSGTYYEAKLSCY